MCLRVACDGSFAFTGSGSCGIAGTGCFENGSRSSVGSKITGHMVGERFIERAISEYDTLAASAIASAASVRVTETWEMCARRLMDFTAGARPA